MGVGPMLRSGTTPTRFTPATSRAGAGALERSRPPPPVKHPCRRPPSRRLRLRVCPASPCRIRLPMRRPLQAMSYSQLSRWCWEGFFCCHAFAGGGEHDSWRLPCPNLSTRRIPMRIFVAVLLLLGAQFCLTAFAPTPAGKAWILWPFAEDSKPILNGVGGLPKQPGSLLTVLLAGVAGVGFLAAALGVFWRGIPAH